MDPRAAAGHGNGRWPSRHPDQRNVVQQMRGAPPTPGARRKRRAPMPSVQKGRAWMARFCNSLPPETHANNSLSRSTALPDQASSWARSQSRKPKRRELAPRSELVWQNVSLKLFNDSNGSLVKQKRNRAPQNVGSVLNQDTTQNVLDIDILPPSASINKKAVFMTRSER